MGVTMSANFPRPVPEAIVHSQQFLQYITDSLHNKKELSFEDWMDTVLYSPGWGYYTGGLAKLSGTNTPTEKLIGDFTTAPELSHWYGRTLAKQVEQVLAASDSQCILEFGAGSGKLAFDILETLNNSTINYFILELSADLKQRQQQTLAKFSNQVKWLDQLPPSFSGCIIANEVMDAMPVKLLEWNAQGDLQEVFISLDDVSNIHYVLHPASNELQQLFSQRMPTLSGYRTEINLRAESWIKELGRCLNKGGILLIDYGFPRQEYYHPQRHQGTLMCHLQHHAHSDPLIYPGLQDITAHVDFTAIADAALEGNLEVLGYTSQARFLMNCGILQQLSLLNPDDVHHYAKEIGPVQKLLSEAEMGELFKVMLLGKQLDIDPIGFSYADRRYTL